MPLALPGSETLLHLPSLGFKVDGAAVGPSAPPPTLGQDTRVVLAELGYSEAEIDTMAARSVI